MEIYGLTVSPFVRKVIITCEIKDLKYSIMPVNPFDQPKSFKKLSPLSKIPALVDNNVTLADSSVICSYLEDQYPNNSILPQSIADKAKARWLETYSDSKLIEVVGNNLFFERVVKPKFLKQPTDEKLVSDNLNNILPEVFDYLETQMPKSGFLFSEDKLSIADIAIGSNMLNAKYASYEVDSSKWPLFAGYVNRVHSTDEFKKCIEMDKALFTG